MAENVIFPLLAALLAAPVVAVVGWRRPTWAAPVGIAMAGLSFGLTLWGWAAGGGMVNLPWAPTWDLYLAFTLDGLAALYAIMATGIGLAILLYSAGYLPLHLEHEERPITHSVRFYAFQLLFMGAMVGLVMSQDLLLIFLFWDVTAIASYYLIGYDHHQAESRRSALMAMLVTGIASILFMVGALLLYSAYRTFSLPTLIAEIQPGPLVTTSVALMAIAGLAKSAQVPFHFWLPQAMVAPTPVSAYLHSATMVAAGVFLLGRLYPLVQKSPLLLDGLLAIGLLSMAVAGVLALTQDVLKRVLAYSTIAQYGYVVTMLGLGGKAGAAGAAFYVLAHALAKSALFLTAGEVTMATEEKRLSKLGGLGRSMPLLAAASGIAAAGLAGLPLTIGFFKDELFFKTAFERGLLFAVLAVIGAALTLAYIWRFWSGIFLGQRRAESHPTPATLTIPVIGLGFLVLAGGLVVDPFARLAQAAGTVTYGAPAPVELAYHLDARPENLMALATYTLGVLVILTRPVWTGAAMMAARLGERAGPEQWYAVGLLYLNNLSRWIYRLELRDLADRIVTILIPAAVLIGIGLIVTESSAAYNVGDVHVDDLPLILALALTAGAGIVVTIPTNHLTQILALSSLSYALAAVYAVMGAPDVALVAVLISTMSTLFFIGLLTMFPTETLGRASDAGTSRRRRWRRDLPVGILVSAFAAMVAWGVLSQPAAQESVAVEQIRLTPAAHAKDVVTAILADFRGLDTLGEITVIAVTLIGLFTLLHWRKDK